MNRAEEVFKKLNLNKCSENEINSVEKICNEFPYQFYINGDILSFTKVAKHHIDLIPNTKPIYVRQYRIPQTHRKVLQDIIDDYERQGIIEKYQSNFNSPAILISKKDDFGGKEDYRLVN